MSCRRTPKVPHRIDRLDALPRLFNSTLIDPLAARLVIEYAAERSDLFARLWDVSGSHYRTEMWRCAARIGVAAEDLDARQDLVLFSDCSAAMDLIHSIGAGAGAGVSVASLDLNSILIPNSIPAADAIGRFELVSRLESHEAVGAMAEAADKNFVSALMRRRGRAFCFEFYSGVVASPSIDAVISSLCLYVVVDEFGHESLQDHEAFPSCLMRKKDVGYIERRSLVDALVEQVALDPHDVVTTAMLTNLILTFRSDPLGACFSIALKKRGRPNAPMRIIRRALQGATSPKTMSRMLSEL